MVFSRQFAGDINQEAEMGRKSEPKYTCGIITMMVQE